MEQCEVHLTRKRYLAKTLNLHQSKLAFCGLYPPITGDNWFILVKFHKVLATVDQFNHQFEGLPGTPHYFPC